MENIRKISVIGAGNMGHQLSLHAAMCGFEVSCTDVSPASLAKAEAFADSYLAGRVEKGRMTATEAEAARARLKFVNDLADAVADADFVIEAAVENLELKRKIFADLDRFAPEHAILATNSSAIVSSKIATATKRPEKVVNIHFFNPALVMKLVEVVQGPHVSDETAQAAMDLCRALGKEAILLKKEVDGFVLNRILFALWREANWLNEMGVASIADIDKACVFGAGHPMGPFRLQDLTGIDLVYAMCMAAFQDSGDMADLPAPGLTSHYARGEYGEKSGQGWYTYSAGK